MSLPARPAVAAVIFTLTMFAVACGSEDGAGAGADSASTGLGVAGSATGVGQAATPQLPESTPPPQLNAQVPPLSSRLPASGSVTFTHDGFRTDVERAVTVEGFKPYASGERVRVTLVLRNLSAPSGGIDTRATINFGGPFVNMLVLPTPNGVHLAHLHRDGTLREEADDGRFI